MIMVKASQTTPVITIAVLLYCVMCMLYSLKLIENTHNMLVFLSDSTLPSSPITSCYSFSKMSSCSKMILLYIKPLCPSSHAHTCSALVISIFNLFTTNPEQDIVYQMIKIETAFQMIETTCGMVTLPHALL